MPTYTFINQATGKTEDKFMSMSELDDFTKSNPHMERVLTAPAIVGGVGMRVKEDGGFRETMSKIAEKHPGSPLADKYGSKTNKAIKTKDILNKHRRRQKNK